MDVRLHELEGERDEAKRREKLTEKTEEAYISSLQER